MRGLTAKLLATTAIPTIAVLLGTGPALADCQPDPPTANGQTITCTTTPANDTDGFDSTASGFTGLNVTVSAGASVTGTANTSAIIVPDGTITNSGTINASGTSTTAPVAGIRNISGGNVSNAAGGTINVTDSTTFSAGTSRSITNYLTDGGPAAIGIYAGNGSGATARSVTNAGTIGVTSTGANDAAVGMEGSGDHTLANTGTITATQNGVAGSGGIAIGMDGSTDGTTNSGTINASLNSSDGGTAIGMRIFNATGAPNAGTANLNSNAITVNFGGVGATGVGVALDSSTGDFSNTGTITVSNTGTAGGTAIGVRTPAAGATALTVTNSGTISATSDFSNSTVTGLSLSGAANGVNSGAITAQANVATGTTLIGVDAAGTGTFSNTGTITVNGTAGIGLNIGANATATNSGTIITSGIGIHMNPGGLNLAGSIFTNTGTVTAGDAAFQASSLSGSTTNPILTNSGTLSSSNANLAAGAVQIVHGDSILNQAAGVITATGTNSNAIVITGTGATPSVITNAGTITGTLNAILGTASAEQVANTGTINGNISLGDGDDSITNSATGVLANDVDLGNGTNSISNDGNIAGNVTSGTGIDTITNTNTIGGTVSLGDGANVLTNSGATSVIGGTVSFGAGNNTATNQGTIGGSVAFGDGTNTFTNTNTVGTNITFGNGPNTLTNSGLTSIVGGDVTFGAGNDNATNEGTIGGTIAFGNGTNTFNNDNIVGTNVTFGSGNDTLTNAGTINGDVAMGDGTNTFTNSTIGVVGGNVTFGAGNDTLTNNGALNGNVTFGGGNDTLTNNGTINGNVDGGTGTNTFTAGPGSIVGGNISNFNQLILLGAGNVQFNGASSVFQTATIDHTVNLANTTLSVANMTVTPAGTLTGNATITGNITNNGTISPGDTTSTVPADIITITGNYVQSSTGRLIIEFQGGNSDALNISGTATVAGTLDLNVVLSPTGIPVGSTYTILSAAGGLTGQFATVNETSTKFFTISFQQSATDIQITLNRSSFVLPTFNSNQRAVTQALNALQGLSVGTAGVFLNTLTFTEKTQAAPVVDQLIPEAALNMATPALVARRAFLGSIAEKAREYGPDYDREGHWWSWASGYGQVADVSSGGTSYGFTTGGVVSGASYGLSPTSALGFVVGASRSNVDVDLQPGNNDHRSVDGAVYGAYIDGPLSATATVSTGYDRFETERGINTGLAVEQASGKVGGYTVAARLEGAYALDMGAFSLSPYLAAQAMRFHHGAYDETGAGTIGLHMAADQVTSIRSTLGVAAEKTVELASGGDLTFHIGAAWEREFGDRILSSRAAFLAAPANTFEITGITQDRNTANVVGGVKAALADSLDLSLRYEGNLGATETVNRGRLDLTWRW